MYIAVDFDGTVVTHEFPRVGVNIGAAPVLRYLASHGHKIILNTMRSSTDRAMRCKFNHLNEAVDWFNRNGVPLFGVNYNKDATFSNSPKVHADLFIDDRGLGIPLKRDHNNVEYVDWEGVVSILAIKGLVNSEDYNSLIHEVQLDNALMCK